MKKRALLFALCALAVPVLGRAAAPVGRRERQRQFQAWFMRGRQSHDGLSPAQHRQQALRTLRQRRNAAAGIHPASAPVSTGGDWSPIGPAPLQQLGGVGPLSGRVSALALDLVNDPSGNLLYAGGAYGGVWKTSNAMAGSPSWTALGDGLQTLAVGCIALDSSSDPAVIYMGSGEANLSADSYYGLGIFKSVDGGANWTLASSADGGAHPFQGLFFSDIKVDPQDPDILLAAAGRSDMAYWGPNPPERGIFRSTDAGATWSLVYNPGHGVTSLAYDPSRLAYYAAVSAQGLVRSSNQGLSWTAMASPSPSGSDPSVIGSSSYFDRAVLAVRSGTLYCLVGGPSSLYAPVPPTDSGLSQSTDGGVTWTKVGLGGISDSSSGDTQQADYDIFLAAPSGGSNLIMGFLDVFSSAAVSGSSVWSNLTHVYTTGTVHTDQHAIAVLDPTHWFIGNDGGVWRTADGGANWANLNTDLSLTQFTSVSPDPLHAGTYFGGSQDNGSEKTTASGPSWTQILDGDGGYTAIHPTVDGQWFSEYFGIDLQRTDNASSSFHTVVTSAHIADASDFYVPYELVPGQPQTVVLGAERIWRGPGTTVSDGSGWSAISPHLGDAASALDLAPSNGNVCYAVTDGASGASKVFRSGNVLAGNPSWADVTGATLPANRTFSCVAVDPLDPATVCVGVQSFGTGHVYRSSDSGAQWTDISGNLPDLPVNSLAYDPQWPAYLYAATDAGVFAVSDGGAAGAAEVWQQMGDKLPNTTVFQIKLSAQTPRQLVAATHGRGAWTLPALVPPTPTITPTFTASPSFTVSPTITQTATPGYAQAPLDKDAVLYPAPARRGHPLCLALGAPFLGAVPVQVYDLAGEQVLTAELGPRSSCLDIDGLPSGIYFAVLDLQGARVVLKFALVGS